MGGEWPNALLLLLHSSTLVFILSYNIRHLSTLPQSVMAAGILVTDTAFIKALPPMLPILDIKVAERVKTHPSFSSEPTQTFEFPEHMGNDFRRDAVSQYASDFRSLLSPSATISFLVTPC